MSIFGFGKKTPDVSSAPQTQNSNPSINLEKSIISLDKTLITLEKKSGFSFNGHRAKVAVAMDYSGSMRSLYRDGSVQSVLTRLMPLALKFDDNGELDVWLFDDGFRRMESMDMGNYANYVDEEILSKGYHMGATNYAPVLQDMLKKYFKEDIMTAKDPTFVIFITDGANADKTATDAVIRESSNKNMFVQFVGIGSASFPYLEKLDDLTGRVVDNTGFIKVSDMSRLSDEQLFEMLLDQYPDWLKNKPF